MRTHREIVVRRRKKPTFSEDRLLYSLGVRARHQRLRATAWKSSSAGGRRLRSKGSGCGHADAMSPLSSSTTEDEDPQSLWQSSSPTRTRWGGGLDCLLRCDARTWVGAAAAVIRGPLKDSTVLLRLLHVGRCGGGGDGGG